jgi:hypothetical protein
MNILKLAAVTFLVLIALIVSSPSATAQGFGIKGGPTYPDFSTDIEDFDFDNKVGTELGFFFGGNRPGIFGFQGEANWLRKRTEASGVDVRIDYIQLATLLRLNIGTRSTSGLAFYGLVGPGFNFKIADSIEGVDVEDALETIDIPILFGGGMEITRFIIEGRYEKGLMQINDNFSGTSEIKSNGFAILFGFRFR